MSSICMRSLKKIRYDDSHVIFMPCIFKFPWFILSGIGFIMEIKCSFLS